MAQMPEGQGQTKRKRNTTRLDMTPMVDLGFLLVTFFMLSSNYAKPHAMKLLMPNTQTTQTMPVSDAGALTFYLAKDAQVYYTLGLSTKLHQIESSQQQMQQLLARQKQKSGERLFVLVKATSQAKYRLLVDVLDELKIADINQFAIVSLSDADKTLLKRHDLQ